MDTTDYIVLGDRLYTCEECSTYYKSWFISDAETGMHCGIIRPAQKLAFCSGKKNLNLFHNKKITEAIAYFYEFFELMGYKIY